MNFFTELSNRWNNDSPAFFEKLKSFGIWLSGTGLALTAVPAMYNEIMASTKVHTEFNLNLLMTISSYMIMAGVIIAVISKTTCKDTPGK